MLWNMFGILPRLHGKFSVEWDHVVWASACHVEVMINIGSECALYWHRQKTRERFFASICCFFMLKFILLGSKVIHYRYQYISVSIIFLNKWNTKDPTLISMWQLKLITSLPLKISLWNLPFIILFLEIDKIPHWHL